MMSSRKGPSMANISCKARPGISKPFCHDDSERVQSQHSMYAALLQPETGVCMSEVLHVKAAAWAADLNGRPELFWLADTLGLDSKRIGHHDKIGVDVFEVARHMVLLLA